MKQNSIVWRDVAPWILFGGGIVMILVLQLIRIDIVYTDWGWNKSSFAQHWFWPLLALAFLLSACAPFLSPGALAKRGWYSSPKRNGSIWRLFRIFGHDLSFIWGLAVGARRKGYKLGTGSFTVLETFIMALGNKLQRLSLVLVFGASAIVIYCFLGPAATSKNTHFDQEKREAGYSLQPAVFFLWEAAANAPGTQKCTSLHDAVVKSTSKSGSNIWQWTYRTNQPGFLHINPDWSKWQQDPTTNKLLSKQIAVYCDSPLSRDGEKVPVFAGMTFDLKLMELTNLPTWPVATQWLQGEVK